MSETRSDMQLGHTEPEATCQARAAIPKPAQQPLTYQAICDKALDMLMEKVGKLPVEHFVFTDGNGRDSRDGTIVMWQQSLPPIIPGEWQDKIPRPKGIMLRYPSSRQQQVSHFAQYDMRLPMAEFAEQFLSKPISLLAEQIVKDFSGFRHVGIFGKLAIPKGCEWAGFAEKSGLWMRMVRYYDINLDLFPSWLDVLYGGI